MYELQNFISDFCITCNWNEKLRSYIKARKLGLLNRADSSCVEQFRKCKKTYVIYKDWRNSVKYGKTLDY